MLLTVAIYWPGLTAWFQKDEFAWLSLRWLTNSWHDVLWALFAPHAQGVIRPWSQGGFFLLLSTLFGVDPRPFHIVILATQLLNLVLLSTVVTRLTRSRAAGFWAAILWTANSALATPMSWIMAYNVILCSTFLLFAFWLFIRYAETGETRYYTAQFIVFLLGFGALEMNLIYPVLVAAYALATRPKLLSKTIPMFVVSALYTAFHFWITPAPTSGVYHVYVDSSIFSTLWLYWKTALGPIRLNLLGFGPSRWRSMLTAILIFALFCFLIDRIRKRDWIALVFPLWFLATISLVLPLRDQFQTMYLTVPTIGLAMWGAWALVCTWRVPGPIPKLAAAIVLAIYLSVSIPVAIADSSGWHRLSISTERQVEGVVNAARKDSGALVLLAGANDQLWNELLYYRPWAAYGMWNVLLTPASRANIHTPIDPDSVQNFFPAPDAVERAKAANKLQVLDIGGDTVRDITADYGK